MPDRERRVPERIEEGLGERAARSRALRSRRDEHADVGVAAERDRAATEAADRREGELPARRPRLRIHPPDQRFEEGGVPPAEREAVFSADETRCELGAMADELFPKSMRLGRRLHESLA